MNFIIFLLALLAIGSLVWTVIQLVKPALFFKAEEANTKQKRPVWYLFGGVLGLLFLIILWIEAVRLQLVSVWILTSVFTLGSLKSFGIVFFYDQFSVGATKIVNTVQNDKKAYLTMVASRAFLFVILCLTILYFAGCLGTIY